jgi:hypothetical protein
MIAVEVAHAHEAHPLRRAFARATWYCPVPDAARAAAELRGSRRALAPSPNGYQRRCRYAPNLAARARQAADERAHLLCPR